MKKLFILLALLLLVPINSVGYFEDFYEYSCVEVPCFLCGKPLLTKQRTFSEGIVMPISGVNGSCAIQTNLIEITVGEVCEECYGKYWKKFRKQAMDLCGKILNENKKSRDKHAKELRLRDILRAQGEIEALKKQIAGIESDEDK